MAPRRRRGYTAAIGPRRGSMNRLVPLVVLTRSRISTWTAAPYSLDYNVEVHQVQSVRPPDDIHSGFREVETRLQFLGVVQVAP